MQEKNDRKRINLKDKSTKVENMSDSFIQEIRIGFCLTAWS